MVVGCVVASLDVVVVDVDFENGTNHRESSLLLRLRSWIVVVLNEMCDVMDR